MGRPFKEGLDYFELDCQMDEKVKLIQAQFGLKGFAVIVKLFQHIYGGHGYYCEWNEDALFLFMAENCSGGGGDNNNLIDDIVRACIKRGIFSADMYENHGILTSEGIQKRYLRATAKRGGIKLEERYLLVHHAQNKISSVKNSVSSVKNSVSSSNNTQRREEKSREEKRREEYKSAPSESARFRDPAEYQEENIAKLIEDRKFPQRLEFALKDWIRYKAEIGNAYRDSGVHALTVMIAKRVDQIGEDAVCDAITTSMGQGWRSIVFDDDGKASGQGGRHSEGKGIGGYDWDAIRRSLDD